MKIKYPIALLGLCLTLPFSALASDGVERVVSFNSDISIEKSSDIAVTESIDYYFPSAKHGIYRYIPYAYTDKDNKKFYLKVSDVSVSRDGREETYKQTYEGDNFVLKIGDADKTIDGNHKYKISYRLNGTINAFADHDELYWNVTGNNWTVPLAGVTAKVTSPAGPLDTKCFTGTSGSTDQNCQRQTQDNTASFSSDEPLTVVVGLQKGVVEVSEKNYSVISNLISQKGLVAIILLFALPLIIPILVLAYCIKLIKRKGQDLGVKYKTIAPEFAPPGKLEPAQMGAILDEKVHDRDLTAEIIKLACDGYITIKEIKSGLFGKDYELTAKKDLPKSKKDYEIMIVDTLFDGNKSVKISDLKKRTTGQKDWQVVKDGVYADMAKSGYFVEDPQKVRNKYLLVGVLMIFAGVFTFLVGSLGISIILSGIIFAITAGFMPQRSAEGTQLLNQIKGFKMFIGEAEKYRSKWAEKENLFFDFLPYAVLFGITGKWAKAFEGMDIDHPDWYQGNWNTFNTVIFVNSLNSFSTGFVSTTSTSASTGGSGFSSGGGFSGGGFGGGGGGSW